MQYKIAHVSVTDWDKLLTVFVAIVCYGLGPSVGTWVLPITHRTWGSGFEQENKATDILKIGVMRICCEAE